MRARVAICLALAACGGARAGPAPVAPPPPAPSTCADVGVILRGPIEVESTQAGPAREAVIAHTCERDRWSTEVITCVASNRRPASCLDQLTAAQRATYDGKLAAWAEQFGGNSLDR